MKKIFFLFIIALVQFQANAQTAMADSVFHKDGGETIYHSNKVDKVAQYPGGEERMMKFIQNNITMPEELKKKQPSQDKVYASFVVEKNGDITDIIIIKGETEACKKEVLRIVNSFPKWEPAIKDNQPVRSQINLPFKFNAK